MALQDWRDEWRGCVSTEDDLVRFVDAIGFCAINSLDRYTDFPSVALAMDRPDALWHAWWMKDDLHVQRRLYYTRLFAGRPGFISLGWLPAFIAAGGAAADELILLGRIPVETQRIYQLIEMHGPIGVRPLKNILAPDERKAATRALWNLERRFIITKTGITGRERATYSYIWDLAERWMPQAFVEADRLRQRASRTLILEHLELLAVPTSQRFFDRVLQWE